MLQDFRSISTTCGSCIWRWIALFTSWQMQVFFNPSFIKCKVSLRYFSRLICFDQLFILVYLPKSPQRKLLTDDFTDSRLCILSSSFKAQNAKFNPVCRCPKLLIWYVPDRHLSIDLGVVSLSIGNAKKCRKVQLHTQPIYLQSRLMHCGKIKPQDK